MPRLSTSVPKYRKHKASGQAVVTLSGKDFYLGPHGTKASKREYDRLVGEWQANGRRLRPEGNAQGVSMAELLNEYRKFADGYYVKNGEPTATIYGIRAVLKLIRQNYRDAIAADFGPLALKALQREMIEAGQSRRYINDHTERIKRIFRWGVSEELIPPSAYQALASVPAIRKGRTEAREMPPVLPVADAVVDATLPHLPPVVADMVRFQRLTGCRPGEVCIVRPCDVDKSDDIWLYRPESHKTEHLGRERFILIGPKAQAILRPYLLREDTAFCFSPAESERRRAKKRNEARTTPEGYGNAPDTNRVRSPKRSAGLCYTNDSYRRAIHRACDAAFPFIAEATELDEQEWRRAHRWSPNRLRHAAATEIRKRFGLESAQVVLGHASADVTQIYAERDREAAKEVMREVG
ncbi:MAG: site-specific integrase [Planctomycetales bacterium]|nr:site-specific integrase [Planctomycetales bacterium]